jgi:DNA-directed RNA polymerase sigma subunit (sigma70/sigma32)
MPNQHTLSKNIERDARILAMRREGKTLAAIAAIYGLSKERVRLLCWEQEQKEKAGP